MTESFRIAPARSSEDILACAALFRAYAAALPIELGYQDFDAELAALPGKYAPPAGELLLAKDEFGEPLGCVAVRPFPEDGCCEMKRLYVAPAARGEGIGGFLVDAIINKATRLGYTEMRLDTLPDMASAIALYEDAGFTRIPAYYDTPIAETVFFSRKLTR